MKCISRWLGSLCVALVLATVIGADRDAVAQVPSNTNEPLPVTVGLASLCSCWLTVYVADSQGLFKKHGLNAKVITFGGGAQSMAAIASGDIQIVGGAGVRGITARAKGLDAVAIFAQTDGFYLQLMAVKDGINTMQDLKGKTVAVRPGALSDTFMRYLLKRNGLTDTVKIVGTPTEQAELALVQTKAVDAVMTNEPNATLYTARNMAKPIINFNNVDELKKNGLDELIPSHTLTYLARESWLSKVGSDEIARRFVTAMREAMELIRTNPDVAIKTWNGLASGFATDEPQIIAESVKTNTRLFSRDGCLTRIGMDNIQKVSMATGELTQVAPYESLATNKYFASGVCR